MTATADAITTPNGAVRHSPQTRQRAIEMFGRGDSQASICRELGIHRQTLLRWAKLEPTTVATKTTAYVNGSLRIEGEASDVAAVLAGLGYDEHEES